MSRKEAVYVIYEVINSNIISEELCEELNDIANCIEYDSFADFAHGETEED